MSKKEVWRVGAVLSLVVVMAMVCGCASSKKPKPVNPYKGVMSDRGNIPYAEPSGRPQTLKASGAVAQDIDVPAPTESIEGDAFVAAPEDGAAFAEEGSQEGLLVDEDASASAPADGAAVAPAAAPAPAKQSFPVVANGKVPSAGLAGKGGARSGASAGQAGAAAAAGGSYTVKSGDILSRIAKEHGVRVSDIKALNPNMNPDKLVVGQVLVMPAGATAQAVNGGATNGAKTVAAGGKAASATPKKGREPIPADGLYTVVANDSLWKIGDRFGVSVSDIRTWNGLTSDRLKIGQQLKLRGEGGEAAAPAAAPAPAEAGNAAAKVDGPVVPDESAAAPVVAPAAEPVEVSARGMDYSVQEGDTIDSICTAMELTREELLAANPAIRTDADLKPGMVVKIIMRE